MSFFSGNKQNEQGSAPAEQEQPAPSGGGFMGRVNEALGGGAKSEAKEGASLASLRSIDADLARRLPG